MAGIVCVNVVEIKKQLWAKNNKDNYSFFIINK